MAARKCKERTIPALSCNSPKPDWQFTCMHNRYRYLRQAGKARDRANCQRSPVESRNVDACQPTRQGHTGGRRKEDDCIGMRHNQGLQHITRVAPGTRLREA